MPPRTPDDRRRALLGGAEAEARVADALEGAGWTVLVRNWRGAGGELDVVVVKDGRLRIVEVKQRRAGDPVGVEAVEGRKRQRLVRAAEAFLADYEDVVDEVCFTVAMVEGGRITWYDDAFDA